MPKFKILDTRYIPITELSVDEVMIRSVNNKRKGWEEFVADIKENGITQPLLAREVDENIVIIDGGHRFAAAQEAGLTEIPVSIVEATDEEILDLQIANNFQRFETRPGEYAKQLQRILALNPHLTEADLARKVNMSTTYIANRLSLNKLRPEIKELVDEGTIPLTNAYALAKLPPEEQVNWVDRAQSQPWNKFAPAAAQAADSFKKTNRAQRPTGFEPSARIRKLTDVRNELQNCVALLKQAGNPVADTKSTDYLNGRADGLRFACHLDTDSVEAAREEYEAREAERARKKAEREAAKVKEGKTPSDLLIAAAAAASGGDEE